MTLFSFLFGLEVASLILVLSVGGFDLILVVAAWYVFGIDMRRHFVGFGNLGGFPVFEVFCWVC